ncbi:putative iron-regulated membrane protein [Nonlabens xylanidelens]|uniref:Putative iron-regulated membrane protein n=1 Tax=Nonlabens xylanidelens TaxID=191564 RepID=A0A2S6IQA6_9FLAO|nr:PepSY domain-containing protein [Nonlabens xylanidelens]PPK96427.1 putative iron-regulated membrane protein [Nonlabens xylanidelens]PQJ18149.1 peptidase [Nonlabens xylanidelens]
MKHKIKLRSWLWKWHFISGIISLPFILLLSITGVIYLFKADYEALEQQKIKNVEVLTSNQSSFQEQWSVANDYAIKKPNSMVVPQKPGDATEFISGRFGGKRSIYVNPYKKVITGEIVASEGFMYKVRKLHGELLLGDFGTKIVELIASWMVILIITGLYVWWPTRGWNVKGFFIPRFKKGKRILFRDIHAISGFWISVMLLLVLAGGFPWTDVFGENFKKVQEITNTGYPATWDGRGLSYEIKEREEPLPLDKIVAIAKEMDLEGVVLIHFPKGKKGTYAISNRSTNLEQQQKIHLNQYTGEEVKVHHWSGVGILMRARMWLMAFHQGEFGLWNWVLMLGTGVILFLMSLSAIFSYALRKPKKNWGIPAVPESFKIDYFIIGVIVLLGIVFPLFGISAVLIILSYYLKSIFQKKPQI